MSAGDNLSPDQFRHEYNAMPSGNATHHAIRAYAGDKQVGKLHWYERAPDSGIPNGRVDSVWTDPEHRRKGVASGMWAAARAMSDLHGIPEPVHSEERSEDGKAWSKAVGGKEVTDPDWRSRGRK